MSARKISRRMLVIDLWLWAPLCHPNQGTTKRNATGVTGVEEWLRSQWWKDVFSGCRVEKAENCCCRSPRNTRYERCGGCPECPTRCPNKDRLGMRVVRARQSGASSRRGQPAAKGRAAGEGNQQPRGEQQTGERQVRVRIGSTSPFEWRRPGAVVSPIPSLPWAGDLLLPEQRWAALPIF